MAQLMETAMLLCFGLSWPFNIMKSWNSRTAKGKSLGFELLILLGYALGEIGPLGLCMSLGFASGAMLYVVFGEILPQSILMYHSKLPAFSAIIGILVGLLIIFL